MPSILEVSQPSAEPVALADAIAFLRREPDTPDSGTIETLRRTARRYIEGMTGLTLAKRNFVQYEESFPFTLFPFFYGQSRAPVAANLRDHRVPLLRCPIAAVQKLIYVGADGNLHGMLPGQDFIVDYARRPGHITPLPGKDWPAVLPGQFFPELFWLTESWSPNPGGLNRVQIFFSAGFTPASTDTEDIKVGAQWQPYLAFAQYSYIVDASGNLQVQITAGSPLTGSDPPTFAAVGAAVKDGACSWFNAGPAGISAATDSEGNVDSDTPIAPAAYQTSHVYPAPSIALDSNGNLEFTQAGLTSGGSIPAWPAPTAAIGTVTPDNGGSWIFLGPAQAPGPEAPNQLIEYQGGTGIPEDLYTAILLMLSHLYYNREPVVEGREGKVADVPHSVSQICSNYRVWDFGRPASGSF